MSNIYKEIIAANSAVYKMESRMTEEELILWATNNKFAGFAPIEHVIACGEFWQFRNGEIWNFAAPSTRHCVEEYNRCGGWKTIDKRSDVSVVTYDPSETAKFDEYLSTGTVPREINAKREMVAFLCDGFEWIGKRTPKKKYDLFLIACESYDNERLASEIYNFQQYKPRRLRSSYEDILHSLNNAFC